MRLEQIDEQVRRGWKSYSHASCLLGCAAVDLMAESSKRRSG